MANKNKADINSVMIYGSYIRSLTPDEMKKGYDIPKSELNNAIFEVNKRIMDLIIHKNFHFMMPYDLGRICIMMKKMRPVTIMPNGLINRAVDYKETNQLWAERPELKGKSFIYHENSNTGGHMAMFKWFKTFGRLKNGKSYGFTAVKDAKRKLVKELKDPFSKVDYYELRDYI